MVVFFAVLRFAAEEGLAAELLALVDFVAVFLAADVDVPVVFFVGEADLAVVLRAAPVDLAAVFLVVDVVLAAVRLAGVDLAAVFLVVDLDVEAAFLAADVDVVAVTLGSFLAPETVALRSAPGRNFGTDVFFARVRSPVRGLRTMRAGRSTFSKAPKPVIATLLPLTSSRVTVSRTDSRAWEADFLFPSKCLDNASMSWLLFTEIPFVKVSRVAQLLDVGKNVITIHAH